jgi:hypothetical protein
MDFWFTDGSGIHNCFGAGIFGPLYNYRESIPMGSLSFNNPISLIHVMVINTFYKVYITINVDLGYSDHFAQFLCLKLPKAITYSVFVKKRFFMENNIY